MSGGKVGFWSNWLDECPSSALPISDLQNSLIFMFFTMQTRGLKHGRAIVVSTCAAVASILTGVLAGMLALHERLPSTPKARLSLLLGW